MPGFLATELSQVAAVAVWLTIVTLGWAAYAAETDLFAPPEDMALATSDSEAGTSRGVHLYSRTGPDARWFLGQWQIPGGDLFPFEPLRLPDGLDSLVARAAAAEVHATHSADGLRYTFVQNGAALPCQLASGRPREFEMLLGGNTRQATPREPVAAELEERGQSPPPLSGMANLMLRLDLRVEWERKAQTERKCAVNQGNVLVALVLNNIHVSPAQVFYYQVSLHIFCPPAPSQSVCLRNLPKPFFWWRGEDKRDRKGNIAAKQYGYDARLPDFGQQFVPVGPERRLTIDLLSQLRALIVSGAYGLDRDLSHWVVGSTYHGQSIWGATAMSTAWHGFRLTADVR